MRLQTHSINPNPRLLQRPHNQIPNTIALRTHSLDIIIIIIQLCPRVCFCSCFEDEWDIIRSNDMIEGGIAVGAVFVEGFIEYIPLWYIREADKKGLRGGKGLEEDYRVRGGGDVQHNTFQPSVPLHAQYGSPAPHSSLPLSTAQQETQPKAQADCAKPNYGISEYHPPSSPGLPQQRHWCS